MKKIFICYYLSSEFVFLLINNYKMSAELL